MAAQHQLVEAVDEVGAVLAVAREREVLAQRAVGGGHVVVGQRRGGRHAALRAAQALARASHDSNAAHSPAWRASKVAWPIIAAPRAGRIIAAPAGGWRCAAGAPPRSCRRRPAARRGSASSACRSSVSAGARSAKSRIARCSAAESATAGASGAAGATAKPFAARLAIHHHRARGEVAEALEVAVDHGRDETHAVERRAGSRRSAAGCASAPRATRPACRRRAARRGPSAFLPGVAPPQRTSHHAGNSHSRKK